MRFWLEQAEGNYGRWGETTVTVLKWCHERVRVRCLEFSNSGPPRMGVRLQTLLTGNMFRWRPSAVP